MCLCLKWWCWLWWCRNENNECDDQVCQRCFCHRPVPSSFVKVWGHRWKRHFSPAFLFFAIVVHYGNVIPVKTAVSLPQHLLGLPRLRLTFKLPSEIRVQIFCALIVLMKYCSFRLFSVVKNFSVPVCSSTDAFCDLSSYCCSSTGEDRAWIVWMGVVIPIYASGLCCIFKRV